MHDGRNLELNQHPNMQDPKHAADVKAERSKVSEPSFNVRQWSIQDGLPTSNLDDIVQDQNGYLWLASDLGLIRFDGHRFNVFDSQEIPELSSGAITALQLGNDGTVWAGTKHSGVLQHRDGRFKLFKTGDGSESREVLQIEQDRQRKHLVRSW